MHDSMKTEIQETSAIDDEIDQKNESAKPDLDTGDHLTLVMYLKQQKNLTAQVQASDAGQGVADDLLRAALNVPQSDPPPFT